MIWVLIGVLSGSLIISKHESREACEGRAVLLREQKVSAKCVEIDALSVTGMYTITPNGFYLGK